MWVLPGIAYILLTIVILAVYVRVICWVITLLIPKSQDRIFGSPFYRVAFSLTDPLIAPYRSILPTISQIDIFSFIFGLVIINLVRDYMHTLLVLSGPSLPF